MEISMSMSTIVIIGALVAIVIGAIACFFGYRVYRVLFAILGFAVGALLGLALAGSLTLAPGQEPVVRIILGVLGGIVGASLAWFLNMVFIFLLGAGIGALVGSGIALVANADNTVQLVIIIVLAVVVGIIAVALQKPFIIVATAFSGAQLIVAGVAQLLSGGVTSAAFNPLSVLERGVLQSMAPVTIFMVVSWLVLGIVGVFVQYKISPKVVKPADIPTPKPALETKTEIGAKAA
jgi:hypothetical protein